MITDRSRRCVLVSVLGVATVFAGCLDDGNATAGEPTEPPTTTASPDDGATPTETAGQPPDPSEVERTPEWGMAVEVTNAHDATHEVHVAIVHVDSGEVVYEGTHEIAPNASVAVFSFDELEAKYGSGTVESFHIEATLDDQRAETTVKTSACHGLPEVKIESDGTLRAQYAIC